MRTTLVPLSKEAGAYAPASRVVLLGSSLLDLQDAGQRRVIGGVEAVDRCPAVDEALHELDLLRVREDVVDLVVEIVDRVRPTDQERIVETTAERVRGAPLGESAGGQSGVRVPIAIRLDGVVVRV